MGKHTSFTSWKANLVKEEDITKLKQELQTKELSVKFKEHGIVRCKRKRKFCHCSVCWATFDTQQKLNFHLRKTHPKFCFICQYCNREY